MFMSHRSSSDHDELVQAFVGPASAAPPKQARGGGRGSSTQAWAPPAKGAYGADAHASNNTAAGKRDQARGSRPALPAGPPKHHLQHLAHRRDSDPLARMMHVHDTQAGVLMSLGESDSDRADRLHVERLNQLLAVPHGGYVKSPRSAPSSPFPGRRSSSRRMSLPRLGAHGLGREAAAAALGLSSKHSRSDARLSRSDGAKSLRELGTARAYEPPKRKSPLPGIAGGLGSPELATDREQPVAGRWPPGEAGAARSFNLSISDLASVASNMFYRRDAKADDQARHDLLRGGEPGQVQAYDTFYLDKLIVPQDWQEPEESLPLPPVESATGSPTAEVDGEIDGMDFASADSKWKVSNHVFRRATPPDTPPDPAPDTGPGTPAEPEPEPEPTTAPAEPPAPAEGAYTVINADGSHSTIQDVEGAVNRLNLKEEAPGAGISRVQLVAMLTILPKTERFDIDAMLSGPADPPAGAGAGADAGADADADADADDGPVVEMNDNRPFPPNIPRPTDTIGRDLWRKLRVFMLIIRLVPETTKGSWYAFLRSQDIVPMSEPSFPASQKWTRKQTEDALKAMEARMNLDDILKTQDENEDEDEDGGQDEAREPTPAPDEPVVIDAGVPETSETDDAVALPPAPETAAVDTEDAAASQESSRRGSVAEKPVSKINGADAPKPDGVEPQPPKTDLSAEDMMLQLEKKFGLKVDAPPLPEPPQKTKASNRWDTLKIKVVKPAPTNEAVDWSKVNMNDIRWLQEMKNNLRFITRDILNALLEEEFSVQVRAIVVQRRARNNWKKCRLRISTTTEVFRVKRQSLSAMNPFERHVFMAMRMRKMRLAVFEGGKMTKRVTLELFRALEIHTSIAAGDEGAASMGKQIPVEMDAFFHNFNELLFATVDEFINELVGEEFMMMDEAELVPGIGIKYRDCVDVWTDVVNEVVDEEVEKVRQTVVLPELEIMQYYAKLRKGGHHKIAATAGMFTTLDTETSSISSEQESALGGLTVNQMLSRYSMITDSDKRRYAAYFTINSEYDEDIKDVALNVESMIVAVQRIIKDNPYNGHEKLSKIEIKYLLAMFPVQKGPKRTITLANFFIVASLAEKMTSVAISLDPKTTAASHKRSREKRSLYNCHNVEELKAKMKSIWLLNNPNAFGQISLSTLEITLRAGRMDKANIGRIISHFGALGREELDLLDFVAYMPLFQEIHEAVTEDPLSMESRVLDAASGILQARKCFMRWRRRVHLRKTANVWKHKKGVTRAANKMLGVVKRRRASQAMVQQEKMREDLAAVKEKNTPKKIVFVKRVKSRAPSASDAPSTNTPHDETA